MSPLNWGFRVRAHSAGCRRMFAAPSNNNALLRLGALIIKKSSIRPTISAGNRAYSSEDLANGCDEFAPSGGEAAIYHLH